MKKIIFIAIAGIIIVGGIGGYFVFKRPEYKECQCPRYTPPTPSFYKNYERQDGKVEAGGKNNKGCQTPPQCILPGKSSTGNVSVDSPFGALPFFHFPNRH